MAIKQLSIFLENRNGRLEAITKILDEKSVDILGLSLADTADFGILRLVVNNVTESEQALRAKGVVLHSNDVTAVEVSAEPGSLAKVLEALNDTQINVEYMYNLALPKNGKNPILILRFSEPLVAREHLRQAGCKLLNAEDLNQL